MEIPVSRLNQRMALQLPAELPLGMVYVVGVIEGRSTPDEGQNSGYFFLAEERFRVRCLLSEHSTSSSDFKNGDRVRAGGHLNFDPQQAQYYLLARDIEILKEVDSEEPDGSKIIEEIDQKSEEAGLVPANLPAWVKQLAPPELLKELGIKIIEEPVKPVEAPEETHEMDPLRKRTAGPKLAMSDELMDFLSTAIDSQDEVELTPDVISYLGTPTEPQKAEKTTARPPLPKPTPIESQAFDIETDETEAVGWLADLEAINEVLEEDEPAQSLQVIEQEQVNHQTPHAPAQSHQQVGFEELTEDGIEIEKNGRGVEEIAAKEPVDEVSVDTVTPLPSVQESQPEPYIRLEPEVELDEDDGEKRSLPWPEIIVVALIVIALIMSVAVVWVVATR
ncbi:MAG: exodeoxyribonuclease VII large subunit [Candidatus Promineifilaceae bacterium]